MSLVAIGIGLLSAYVALALLRLIGLFTNLFFFQRWETTLVSPAGNQLGPGFRRQAEERRHLSASTSAARPLP